VKFTSELRDATSQWAHTMLSATRQRWPPHLHPKRAGWYSIYRPRKDEAATSYTFYLSSSHDKDTRTHIEASLLCWQRAVALFPRSCLF